MTIASAWKNIQQTESQLIKSNAREIEKWFSLTTKINIIFGDELGESRPFKSSNQSTMKYLSRLGNE